jgi:hypothetical protein
MNDCLDIIKIIFYAENHNSTKLENTVKSESEVCFKIVYLITTLKNVMI